MKIILFDDTIIKGIIYESIPNLGFSLEQFPPADKKKVHSSSLMASIAAFDMRQVGETIIPSLILDKVLFSLRSKNGIRHSLLTKIEENLDIYLEPYVYQSNSTSHKLIDIMSDEIYLEQPDIVVTKRLESDFNLAGIVNRPIFMTPTDFISRIIDSF